MYFQGMYIYSMGASQRMGTRLNEVVPPLAQVKYSISLVHVQCPYLKNKSAVIRLSGMSSVPSRTCGSML